MRLSEIERQQTPRERCSIHLSKTNSRIIANDTDAMFELKNEFAPEHLEIATWINAYDYLGKVENVVPSFLVTSANQLATTVGANHVLPTTATNRFSSALGVRDFCQTYPIYAIRQGNDLIGSSARYATLKLCRKACRPTPRQLKRQLGERSRKGYETAEIERNTFETKELS